MDGQDHNTKRRAGFARMGKVASRALVPAIGALLLCGVSSAFATEFYGHWYVGGTKITQATPISWKGNLTLRFNNVSFGEYEIKCADTGSGQAETEGKSTLTTWTTSGCKSVPPGETQTYECKSPAVAAGVLGHGQLFALTKPIENGSYKITFEIKCEGFKGAFEECAWNPGEALTNTTTGVLAEVGKNGSFGCTGRSTHIKYETHQEFTTSGGRLEVK